MIDEKIAGEIMKKYPGYEVLDGYFDNGKKRFFGHITGDNEETVSVSAFSWPAKSLKTVSKYTGKKYGKSEIVYTSTSEVFGFSRENFLMVAEIL